MVYTTQDIKKLGTILAIWAHPDDETFSSAGLMYLARQNSQRVVVVTATEGAAGKTADESRWPQSELAHIRRQELKKALDIVGVQEHYWPDYDDGTLSLIEGDAPVKRLLTLVDEVQPQTVLSFEPNGITGHDDHKAVHTWAEQVVSKTSPACRLLMAVECEENAAAANDIQKRHTIYMNNHHAEPVKIDDADVCIRLNKRVAGIKHRALLAHATQTSRLLEGSDGRRLLNSLTTCECYMWHQ